MALIALAAIAFKLLPELLDNIWGLVDLKDRDKEPKDKTKKEDVEEIEGDVDRGGDAEEEEMEEGVEENEEDEVIIDDVDKEMDEEEGEDTGEDEIKEEGDDEVIDGNDVEREEKINDEDNFG